MKITKDMVIADVVRDFPNVVPVLFENGLHCVGCHVAAVESLEDGFKAHGLNDEDIDRVIEQMNKKVSEPVKVITITDDALRELKSLMISDNKENFGLRVNVHPGEEVSYDMNFEERPTDSDEIIEENTLTVFIDKSVLDKVKGCVIDFHEGKFSIS